MLLRQIALKVVILHKFAPSTRNIPHYTSKKKVWLKTALRTCSLQNQNKNQQKRKKILHQSYGEKTEKSPIYAFFFKMQYMQDYAKWKYFTVSRTTDFEEAALHYKYLTICQKHNCFYSILLFLFCALEIKKCKLSSSVCATEDQGAAVMEWKAAG